MERRISATEAARSFSDVINRVLYRGDAFIVERGGVPVCRIVPAGGGTATGRDLVRILSRLPRPDAAYLDTVEGVTRKQPKLPKIRWPR